MLTFDSAQLSVWLSQFFWPLLRVLALISTAPLFSEKQISKRVKIGLGGLIVLLIAPTRRGDRFDDAVRLCCSALGR
mgnify:CR=1 FL=1